MALTAVSGVATVAFVFFIDRGRTITGAAAGLRERREVLSIRTAALPAPAGD
jgi:hypothetical protein